MTRWARGAELEFLFVAGGVLFNKEELWFLFIADSRAAGALGKVRMQV